MKVQRIVANLEVVDPARVAKFYAEVFELEVLMDHGWIVTVGSSASMQVQASFMTDGGSGMPVPALSIEVDDLDEAFRRAKQARATIEYGPVDEPWGVRRFFLRDPLGALVNVLAHR